MARRAMVACSQPLAAAAGYDILKRGGNAADAAVAVASCLTVTEPTSTGIGGDLFVLFYDNKTKKVKALNGSGRSPKALNLDFARAKGWVTGHPEATIPDTDLNAVTVPGAAAGWCDTVSLFGGGKLSLHDILAPAIDLAENGFPVEPIASYMWNESATRLTTHSTTYAAPQEWLISDPSSPTGLRGPHPSEVFAIPTLASTFRTLAAEGKKGFYEGRIGQAILETVKKGGGVMTEEDLKGHESTPSEPISAVYEGVRVWEHAPNGQGLVALIALRILHHLQLSGRVPHLTSLPHNSPAYLHALITALRLAFADARAHICDPAFAKVPVEELLGDKFISERVKAFDADKWNEEIVGKGGIGMEGFGKGKDTVYFSVVDAEGNACSFINSTYMSFGSGAVVPGTGIILQNRGANFSLVEGHPNVLEGGKRPYHTIIPAMATWEDTGDLWLSYGVMGGFNQPQGHVQVLLNLLRGMDPQTALDAPRFCLEPTEPPEYPVHFDEGVDEATLDALRKMGHKVVVLEGWKRGTMGRGQVIETHADKRTGTRVLIGGSDLRGDGMALGF
ncbi:acylase ACY 1 [Gonapodya prolifera JEL478]|uniref:Acylase ACY 1 n=1 Tax=Gonapodya prolifera (strain JEL478) TaxID=1344416 RepID=A0A139AI68_GONPJ|nr:acylase ACY 1 [Gonapodya prolifera JEL478]|eukprot:KXS16480.1 acylase ACY 1 [Gonapodya prolifera JEL478]